MDYPVETLLDTKFIKVFDLHQAPGQHYYNVSRRPLEETVMAMDDEAFASMVPDAVSLCVIWHEKGKEDRIVLNLEYRYPLGRYVLSVPAGLIDPEDRGQDREAAIRAAAERELYEETGLSLKEGDRFTMLNPCLYSSPGLTDESNAMVRIDLYDHDAAELTQTHAVGTEKFEGFRLVTAEEARPLLFSGVLSVYTWIGLSAFLFGLGAE